MRQIRAYRGANWKGKQPIVNLDRKGIIYKVAKEAHCSLALNSLLRLLKLKKKTF